MGAGVCFHSPQAVPEGSVLLAIFLKQLSQNFLYGGEKITRESGNQELQSLIATMPEDRIPPELQNIEGDGNPIEKWLLWGEYLRQEYEIEQFALMAWDELE